MDFPEAKQKIGSHDAIPYCPREVVDIIPIKPIWLEQAHQFINSSHNHLLNNPNAISLLSKRGLKISSIKKFDLGWNPTDAYFQGADWGLEERIVNGKNKKRCLPAGIVIPSIHEEKINKIKIRKAFWKEGDKYGKYYEVPGGGHRTPVYGNPDFPFVIIVEAELDAMLVVQEAGEFCCCIALGGAQKRPDSKTDQWLREKRGILFCLDFDEAGKKEYEYWKKSYSSLFPWPVPKGKSPEEAFNIHKIDIQKWIMSKINKLKK